MILKSVFYHWKASYVTVIMQHVCFKDAIDDHI